VPPYRRHAFHQTQTAVWFLAESSSRQPSVATTFRYAASTEVHWHSPVPSFPRPVRLDGSGSPWASPVCFRTPRYRGACAGREPTWALVGAVATRHRPLIWCDFVSHSLYEILASFRAKIGAGIPRLRKTAMPPASPAPCPSTAPGSGPPRKIRPGRGRPRRGACPGRLSLAAAASGEATTARQGRGPAGTRGRMGPLPPACVAGPVPPGCSGRRARGKRETAGGATSGLPRLSPAPRPPEATAPWAVAGPPRPAPAWCPREACRGGVPWRQGGGWAGHPAGAGQIPGGRGRRGGGLPVGGGAEWRPGPWRGTGAGRGFSEAVGRFSVASAPAGGYKTGKGARPAPGWDRSEAGPAVRRSHGVYRNRRGGNYCTD
jgi:hypothetical protein